MIRLDTKVRRVTGQLHRDCIAALRGFRRAPVFTLVVVLTLGLGIGATAAVYSVIDAAFFRALPFPRASELVQVDGIDVPIDPRLFSTPPPKTRLAIADLNALRDVFSGVAAYATGGLNLSTGPEPLRIDATFVTAEFFATLQRGVHLGRVFTRDETNSAAAVAVLSYRLWTTQFGADPTIVGRDITLNRQSYEVVGVMPADFRFPAQAQLWVPLPVPVPASTMSAFQNFIPSAVVARLADSVVPEIARERLDVLSRELVPQGGQVRSATGGIPSPVTPLQQSLLGNRSTGLTVLMISAALMLLVACTNVATLLLWRGLTRRHEFEIYAALGATRIGIIRRLLVESVILAFAGAAIGVAVALGTISLMAVLMPPAMDGLAPARLDLRVLTFTLCATLGTGLLSGISPALDAAHKRLGNLANGFGTRGVSGPGRVSRALVVVQIAVASILVIGSVLMVTSLRTLLSIDPGMRIDQVVTARLSLPTDVGPDALETLVRSIVTRLAESPGIEGAAAVNLLPFAQERGVSGRVSTEGNASVAERDRPAAPLLVISPGYFRALGVELLQGRDFEWTDRGSDPVALINRTLADYLWPGRSAVGERFQYLSRMYAVVGVVEDVRISQLTAPAGPQVYLPVGERPQSYQALVIRGTSERTPSALISQIRDAVRDVDPALPIYAIQPLESVIASSFAMRRVNSLVMSAFGTLALLLAAIGVYGVLASSVAQRTREIGIRMALGAKRGHVIAAVVRNAVFLAVVGTALGVVAALATTRYLEDMLYGVTPRDPSTFGAVVLTFLIVAVVAAVVPARTAARVDPVTTIRHE